MHLPLFGTTDVLLTVHVPSFQCLASLPADTAVLGPKVALVSTLSSLSPAPPFLFRTYQLPHGSEALAAQIGAHAGKPCALAWSCQDWGAV